MGFRLFHHIAILEVMPYCDYLSSETSCTSPHSLRQSFQRREHNPTSKSARTATWSMADTLSSINLLASIRIQMQDRGVLLSP